MIPVISLIVSVLGLIAALLIPVKVMWNQAFIDLNSTYMGYDYADALNEIINFFYEKCHKNFDEIEKEYKRRYYEDFKEKGTPKKQPLHYQRRLVAQFYYNLDVCTGLFGIRPSLVRKLYTKNEKELLKIIFYMNQAVENSPDIYKDISTSERLVERKNVSKINRHIYHLYKIL